MSDGYFSTSFEALIGFVVTIVGIYLVVRQLHEAKLASQMGGLLALEQMALDLGADALKKISAVTSGDWESIPAEEAHRIVFDDPEAFEAWNGMVAWHDLLAVLVRRGALDAKLVYMRHGSMTELWYSRVEKVIQVERRRL